MILPPAMVKIGLTSFSSPGGVRSISRLRITRSALDPDRSEPKMCIRDRGDVAVRPGVVSHGVPFRDEVFKYAGELDGLGSDDEEGAPDGEFIEERNEPGGRELAGAVVEGQRHDGYSLGAGIDWARVRLEAGSET